MQVPPPAPPAIMQFLDGNQLLRLCGRAAQGAPGGMCQGYVAGIVDSEKQRALMERKQPYFCLPQGGDSEQDADIARKWLEANPDERHALAAGLVSIALSDAYPCSPTKK